MNAITLCCAAGTVRIALVVSFCTCKHAGEKMQRPAISRSVDRVTVRWGAANVTDYPAYERDEQEMPCGRASF